VDDLLDGLTLEHPWRLDDKGELVDPEAAREELVRGVRQIQLWLEEAGDQRSRRLIAACQRELVALGAETSDAEPCRATRRPSRTRRR
jgi:hypothetical protein